MEKVQDNSGRTLFVLGAVLGALTALPVIGLLYLGSQFAGLPFVPFDVFDWLARTLPGNIINTGIDSMVRFITTLGLGPISATAKSIEQLTGVVAVVVAGAVLGLGIALIVRFFHWSGRRVGTVLGVAAFIVVAAIELALGSGITADPLTALLWLAFLFIGWGALLGGWIDPLPAREEAPVTASGTSDTARSADSRRAFLLKLAGGSIGIAVVAAGAGRLLQARAEASGASQPLTSLGGPTGIPPGTPTVAATAAPALDTPLPPETLAATVRDRVQPVPGTRPELTPNDSFYRIDIDTLPPTIDKGAWKLHVAGLFDRPRELSLADLAAYPAVTETITQSCISNPVGGDLIGTTKYTGARMRDVLADLGLKPGAQALYIQSDDGFYETVEMRDLMDARTLLVYGMNGETLPVEHGFPLRVFIPNRYGMKQPKWIVSIEAVDRPTSGYWVDRGWSATAHPQIVSVIDAVAQDKVENGRVPVGGIAWAGDRGIAKVQVQVDGGPWNDAILRTPPLSPLTWVQWRYDWPVVPGNHTFLVRATDGTGAQQIEAQHDTYPDGATGYDFQHVKI